MILLPYLNKKQRDEIQKLITNTIVDELATRHWGSVAKGASPNNKPRLYLHDIRGLFLAAGVLRYALNDMNADIYYRGQNKDWEIRPAIFRSVNSKTEASNKIPWLEEALAHIDSVFDPIGNHDEREALAQHYGLPTRFIDVVDHVQTAAWFAYHRPMPEDKMSSPPERTFDDSVGYIYVLFVPRETNKWVKCIDLRRKPSNWLRPHVQQAFAIGANNPVFDAGSLHKIHLVTFIVPSQLLKLWSNYEVITKDIMFPDKSQDQGAYFWHMAMDKLDKSGIGITPK